MLYHACKCLKQGLHTLALTFVCSVSPVVQITSEMMVVPEDMLGALPIELGICHKANQPPK
jgi:hypothetical protein